MPDVVRVAANAAFGTDLYALLTADGGNVVFSPASIAVTLHMALVGSRGTTAAELAAALHVHGPEAAHDGLRQLDGIRTHEDLVFRALSTMWIQSRLAIRKSFLDQPVTIESIDFEHQPEAARQAINEAVAKQTAGKTTDLIEPGLVDTLTRLLLVNAVYLNARWEHEFPAQQTTEASFYPERTDARQQPPSRIDMMHLDGRLAYHDGDGYQAVLLPYKGGPLAMAVVLPDEPLSAFAARLPELMAGLVPGLLADSKEHQVDLRLPRFRITAGFRLRDTLQALGVVRAFDDDADFGGILERALHPDDAPLRIGEVVHKAYIDVDEEGTEAAAVSAVVCMAGAAFPLPKKRKVFTADRPFLFAIVDTTSGLPLFLGQFTRPPKK